MQHSIQGCVKESKLKPIDGKADCTLNHILCLNLVHRGRIEKAQHISLGNAMLCAYSASSGGQAGPQGHDSKPAKDANI